MKAVDVRATIPGTITIIHVQDGARVDAGETILEVECMKTLWPVSAPAAGVVRLRAAAGELIGQDQVVATIEAE